MIYLYATPTNGADIASAAQVFSRNPQLKGLLPIQGNDFLTFLSNSWVAVDELRSLPTYCAFEGKPTDHVWVVPRESATAGCNRSFDPMDANHIEIVKPVGRDDERYSRLATAIKTVLSEQLKPAKLTSVPSHQAPETTLRVLTADEARTIQVCLTQHPVNNKTEVWFVGKIDDSWTYANEISHALSGPMLNQSLNSSGNPLMPLAVCGVSLDARAREGMAMAVVNQ